MATINNDTTKAFRKTIDTGEGRLVLGGPIYTNITTYEIRPEECNSTQWVDVKDAKPEDGGWYLCYLKYTTSVGISHEQHICSYNAHDKTWHCPSWSKGCVKITHWMPLPQPPGAE